MGIKRQILIASIFALSFFLWAKWQTFQTAQQANTANAEQPALPQTNADSPTPSTPVVSSNTDSSTGITVPNSQTGIASQQFITVTTDLSTIKINTQGGGIESLVLKEHATAAETPEIGFDLLKKTPNETFISQSGLIGNTGTYPNHNTLYSIEKNNYELGEADSITVPLSWVSEEGNTFVKTFTFNRDSYVIDVDYQVTNNTNQAWSGFLYAQFKRTQPLDANNNSFLQLPSFMGGVKYTQEDKYDKVSFKDIQKENIALNTDSGWIGMLQHYFTGVWMPQAMQSGNNNSYGFYSSYVAKQNPEYIMGYKTLTPLTLQASAR